MVLAITSQCYCLLKCPNESNTSLIALPYVFGNRSILWSGFEYITIVVKINCLAKGWSQCKGRRQGAWLGWRPSPLQSKIRINKTYRQKVPSWSRERRRPPHGRRRQTSSHAASTRPRPRKWQATRRKSDKILICIQFFYEHCTLLYDFWCTLFFLGPMV